MRMFISASILALALAACDSGSVMDVAEVATEVAQTQMVPACDDVSVQQVVSQQVRQQAGRRIEGGWVSSRLGERVAITESSYDDVLQERSCQMLARYDQTSNLRINYLIVTDASGQTSVETSSMDVTVSAEWLAHLAAEQHATTEVAVTP